MSDRPCKNCSKDITYHVEAYTPDDHPLGMQCIMTPFIRANLAQSGRPVWTMAWYQPMDNLEYLEYKDVNRV